MRGNIRNRDIALRFSDESTPEKIIYELMKIEEDVFLPEYRGEYLPIRNRFRRFKDMFLLAYDGERVIGYLCYFPISSRLHDAILLDSEFHDDDILPEDVVSFENQSNIYLLSVAVYGEYQGCGIGSRLMDALFKRLQQEEQKGNEVTDVLASVVSEKGEKLVNKYGFLLHRDLSMEEGYKIYHRKGAQL